MPPLTYSGLGNVVVTNPETRWELTNAFSFACGRRANNNSALTGTDSFY
jgi:hypothetical protein